MELEDFARSIARLPGEIRRIGESQDRAVLVTDKAGDKPGKLFSPQAADQLKSGPTGDEYTFKPATVSTPVTVVPKDDSKLMTPMDALALKQGQSGDDYFYQPRHDGVVVTPKDEAENVSKTEAAELKSGQTGDEYMYLPNPLPYRITFR